MLSNLEQARDFATTIYFSHDAGLDSIREPLAAVVGRNDVENDLSGAISRSRTGAALFWGDSNRTLVLPPFPISQQGIYTSYYVAPLRQLLEQDLTVALLLLRLGSFAVGVARGEKLLSSKVGTGLVHARHRQGGSSSRRFERHREKQMEAFFTRVCGHARERIEPCIGQLDYLVYGGERYTILEFRKQCHFLGQLDDRTMERLLSTRAPRQPALEAAVRELWSSELIRWPAPQHPAPGNAGPGQRLEGG